MGEPPEVRPAVRGALLHHGAPATTQAGLSYTLSEAADDGHGYLPAPNLMTDAAKIPEVPAEPITPCLDELATA